MSNILNEWKDNLPLWLRKWVRSAAQDRRTIASDGKFYDLVPVELMPKPNVIGGFGIVEEKPVEKKKVYEAGITSATNPYEVRWTGEFAEAKTFHEAEDLFGDRGFYRNLVVREVPRGVTEITKAKNDQETAQETDAAVEERTAEPSKPLDAIAEHVRNSITISPDKKLAALIDEIQKTPDITPDKIYEKLVVDPAVEAAAKELMPEKFEK